MAPIVHGLEQEYGDRIAFQSLNVGEADGRAAARAYRIPGHPTLLLLNPEGEQIWSRVGVVPRPDIEAAFAEALAVPIP